MLLMLCDKGLRFTSQNLDSLSRTKRVVSQNGKVREYFASAQNEEASIHSDERNATKKYWRHVG
jgi:hypothetical protein